MLRKRSQSWRETLSRTLDRTHGERADERERKKLTISTPRNDFQHRAHIGANGESFGNIQSLNSAEAPEVVKKALTLNNREEYATLTKKSKSPVLQISKTIIRPDRPQIFKRRADSESDDDDDDSIAKSDYSDLLSDVLAVMDRKNEMSTVVEEDSDDSSVLSEPESLKIKGKSFGNDDSYMAITNYNDLTPKRTSTIMMTTDSSANESPEKKQYSSSEDVDEDREKRLAAVIDRFRSDVKNDKTIDSESTLPSDEEGSEFVIEEESFCDEPPIVTLRNERSRASRNQEKRASTIDQIKRNELTLLGAQKKNSIQSTDREVML